jgi:hypothetical protein
MDWLMRIFSRPAEVAPTDIATLGGVSSATGAATNHNINTHKTSASSTAAVANGGASTDTDGDNDEDLGIDDSDYVLFEYHQPDFDEKYWRYMKIEPGVYGLQRFRSEPSKQQAEPIHYLVTTDNAVYRWCIALERERLRSRRRESQRPPVSALERRPQHVPGVVGAFVAMGTGRRPVFAFEEGERCLYLLDDVLTADYSLHETLLMRCRVPIPSSNVHLCRFSRTGLTSGETTVDRLARASAATAASTTPAAPATIPKPSATAAAPPSTAVDYATHTIDLEIDGTTSGVKNDVCGGGGDEDDLEEASLEHDPARVVDGRFTGYSPVDPRDSTGKKRRWIVIGRDYWELYHAFEEMHYRSGCYLMKLAANGGVPIEASERKELEHARGEHTMVRNLELLVRRMADPNANETERLRILAQAVDVVNRLDVLHRAQASINDK